MSESTIRNEQFLEDVATVETPRSFESSSFDGFSLSATVREETHDDLLRAVRQPGVLRVSQELIKAEDHHTLEHQVRVAKLTAATCAVMGLDRVARQYATVAGVVHDNAKDRLQHVIHLDRRLTDDEMGEIRCHPELGAVRVREAGLPGIVVDAVRNHHAYQSRPYGADEATKYDPSHRRRLTAEQVVGTSLAVADVFDAARSARPERQEPCSFDNAMEMVYGLKVPETVKIAFHSMFERRAAVVIPLAA